MGTLDPSFCTWENSQFVIKTFLFRPALKILLVRCLTYLWLNNSGFVMSSLPVNKKGRDSPSFKFTVNLLLYFIYFFYYLLPFLRVSSTFNSLDWGCYPSIGPGNGWKVTKGFVPQNWSVIITLQYWHNSSLLFVLCLIHLVYLTAHQKG